MYSSVSILFEEYKNVSLRIHKSFSFLDFIPETMPRNYSLLPISLSILVDKWVCDWVNCASNFENDCLFKFPFVKKLERIKKCFINRQTLFKRQNETTFVRRRDMLVIIFLLLCSIGWYYKATGSPWVKRICGSYIPVMLHAHMLLSFKRRGIKSLKPPNGKFLLSVPSFVFSRML